MSEWKKYKLGDLVSHKKGFAFKSKDYKSNGVRIIRVSDLTDSSIDLSQSLFIEQTLAENFLEYQLTNGDIIITTVGSWEYNPASIVGKVVKVPSNAEKSLLNQNAVRLRALQGANQTFLYYRMKCNDFKEFIIIGAQGSANQAAITLQQIFSFEFDLPSIKEQQRIASILSSLDDKIELNRRMNQTLEQIAATLFKKYFVDDIDLDNLPEGWKHHKVNDLFDITIGRTPPRVQQEWFSRNPEDVKWISIKDMGMSGVYISETSEYLTNEAVKKFNVPIIPDNTVVLSFKLTMGRVSITTEKMLSNEAIAHFIPKSSTYLSPEYIYLFLKNFEYDSLGNTSSIATAVNSNTIKGINILTPNKDIEKLFNLRVKAIFKKIKSNQQEIKTLSQIRDYLLPKLMSGEIDVTAINQNQSLHEEVFS